MFACLALNLNAYGQRLPPGIGRMVERIEIPTSYKMMSVNNAGAMLGLRK